MVDYKTVFLASLARVTTNELDEAFFGGFYDRFIGSSPAMVEMFSGTDMPHQKKMLRESLQELTNFSTSMQLNNYIITLARIHGVRGRNIDAASYDVWLDSLVETVRAIDPECTTNVELAWRLILAPGITFMKFYRDK